MDLTKDNFCNYRYCWPVVCLFQLCTPHYTPEFTCQQFISPGIWHWVQHNLADLYPSLVPIFAYSTSHHVLCKVRCHECGLCSKAYSSWKNIYTTIYQALYYVNILSLGRVGLLIAKFITVGLSLVLQAVWFSCGPWFFLFYFFILPWPAGCGCLVFQIKCIDTHDWLGLL